MVDSIPVGACPEKWAKAQAIKARQVAVFAQARERNAAMEEVATISHLVAAVAARVPARKEG